MRKNKIFSSLLAVAAVLCVSGQVAAQELNKVEAANADNSKEKWSAIGTINGSSWNKDFPLTYDSVDDRYELEIVLTAGNEFKIRLNNAWTTSIGYGGHTGAGISTYLSNSGGNFKVKTTGNYVLWVKDDNVRNYGDKSYGFGIDKAAEVVYHTVTHYNSDGSVLEIDSEVLKDSAYEPAFAEVEGYRLEGWYTDKSLTSKFEKGTKITEDIDLYPKYVPAEDYTVYLNANGYLTGTLYAYMWRDNSDGGYNADWPGTVITEGESGYYEIDVDASKSFDKIIFNNGTSQTVDLDLAGAANMDTYKLTKDGTNYGAELVKTGASYEVKALFNDYYGTGYYNKHTIINLTDAAKEEAKVYFHAKVNELERNTVYEGDSLTMTIPGNDEYSSKYGTDGTDMPHYSNGSATPDYVVKGTTMEEKYVTLYDFATTFTEGWTLENGVYTTTNESVIDLYRNFTAPLWVGDENYIDLVKVTAEVIDGNLVMKLYADKTNSALISDKDLVFSIATISKVK